MSECRRSIQKGGTDGRRLKNRKKSEGGAEEPVNLWSRRVHRGEQGHGQAGPSNKIPSQMGVAPHPSNVETLQNTRLYKSTKETERIQSASIGGSRVMAKAFR